MPVTADDLRQLDADALAVLLTLRPDVLGPTDPLSLEEVAARLSHRASLERAVGCIDTPTLQVARALVQLGCQDDPTALPRFLRLSSRAELEALDGCLHVLDRLLLREDCGCLADGLAHHWNPYGLGPNVLRALGWRTNDQLREALRHWGQPTGGDKMALVERLAPVLTDGPRLAAALAEAPESDRQLLEAAAQGDGYVELGWQIRSGRRGPGSWLVERGFVDGSLSGSAQLPGEVTIALRGDSWRPAFDWRPPRSATTVVARELVDREAAAAVRRFLRLLTDLVREAGRTPLRLNRDGTLGKRERSRVAGVLRVEPSHVTFAVALAFAGGLLAHLDDGLSPTAESVEWTALPPGPRHVQVLLTWSGMQQQVLADPDLTWSPLSHLRADDSKHTVVRVLADAPDRAVVDVAELARVCAWRAPVALGGEQGLALVTGALAEATLLGVVGVEALSSLGHALASGADPGAVVDGWLGAESSTARLQADLTAIVLGEPAQRLARVLDLVASREASDQATTWRFDARSLARALDAGHTPDGLLAALASVAEGDVPQPLEYLVRDTGRRHGRLRVGAAACYLRSDDQALLAEAAADSRLRPLGLRLLAPGVLVGEAPLERVLERLRATGYLPVHEDAGGASVPEALGAPLAQVSEYVAVTSLQQHDASGPMSAHADAVRLLGLPDRASAPLMEIAGTVVDSGSLRELFEARVARFDD